MGEEAWTEDGAVSVYIWGFDCYDNYMLLLAGLTDVNCLDVFELFSLFQPVSEDSLKTFKLRNLMKNKSDKMFVRINTVFLPLSVSISLVSAVESNEVYLLSNAKFAFPLPHLP